MIHNPNEVSVGELVILDKGFKTSMRVTVKKISPRGIFATVQNYNGEVWQLRTDRLSKLPKPKTNG